MATLDLDALTSSDLLLKLVEYGSPINPLIGAPRCTLIKRLKYLMQLRKTHGHCSSEQFRRLSRYSSGDEDSEVERKEKCMSLSDHKFVGCMQSLMDVGSGRLMPSPASRQQKYKRVGALKEQVSMHLRLRGSLRKYPTRFVPTNDTRYVLERSKMVSNNVSPRPRFSNMNYGRSVGVSKNADDLETGSDSDAPGSVVCKRRPDECTGKQEHYSPTEQSTAHERRGTRTDNIRKITPSRMLNSNNGTDPSSYPRRVKSHSGRNDHAGITNTGRGTPSVTPDYVVEREHQAVNGVSAKNRNVSIQRTLDLAKEFKTIEERVWISLHYQKVSMILVAVVLLFFFGLGLMYVNVRFKDSDPFGSYGTGRNTMCNQMNMKECLERKSNLVFPSNSNGRKETSSLSASNKMKKLVEPNALGIHNPVIPIAGQLHWLKDISFGFTSWVSLFMTTSIAVTGLLFGVWRYKNYQEIHRQEVYLIVNKVIDMLKRHHERMQLPGAVGSNYLSVDQCRDRIISSRNKPSLMAAWQDAVQFIDDNESRICSELQYVRGNLVKMWQWLPNNMNYCVKEDSGSCVNNITGEDMEPSLLIQSTTQPSTSCNQRTRRNKVWQGQAFETIAGSPNSLPCSPTPCLKIRHMFDPAMEHGDDWPLVIHDAILEKCEGINVLHIFVDFTSHEGCVFMKCSSQEDAGKAYRALHGWWFDSKLVTVKYLRTGRYHERFPEAAQTSSHLRPSNSKDSSLQELWHFL